MTATLLPLISLFLSMFLIMLGSGLTNILYPLKLSLNGVGTDDIGLVMAMFSVGLFFGGRYCKALLARIGHIRLFASCSALAAIHILLCTVSDNPILWGAMRVVMGFSIACTNTISDGWLSERATNDTRSRILATNQIVVLSAMFAGSFMINLGSPDDRSLFVITALLLIGSLLPIAFSRVQTPEVDETPSMSIKALYQTSPAGVAAVLACGLTFGSILSMLAIYGKANGISGFELSLLVGVSILGSFVLQFPVGYFADRFSRRAVMVCIVLISSACCLAIPLMMAANAFSAMLVLVCIASGITASLYPLGLAEAFDRLPQQQMGGAVGAMIIVYAIGGIFGPYVSGLVMEHLGNDEFFYFMTLCQLGFVGFILYRMKVRQAIPIDMQENFVPQGASGLLSAELDPRTEYSEAAAPLSPQTLSAMEIAKRDPDQGLLMLVMIARTTPELLEEAVGEVAPITQLDATELYNRICEQLPEVSQQLAQILVSAVPEQSTELAATVFEDLPAEEIPELAAAFTEAAPEQSLEILEAATEAVIEESPEMVTDIAEAYLSNVSDNLEEMRYADRLADESGQAVTDMLSMMAEKVPEQAMDIAVSAAEAVPEAASDLVETLHESDHFDEQLVSDIKDKPSD